MMTKKTSVFISHTAPDTETVEAVRRALEASGVSVWTLSNVSMGDDWQEGLARAIRQSRVFVFIVSPDNLQSGWFQFEIGAALGRLTGSNDVKVIPVLIRGASWHDLPTVLRSRTGIDANKLNNEELAQRLENEIQRATAA